MRTWVLALLVSAGLTATAGATASAYDISGVWRLSDGKVTVQIAPCGGKNYCGKVVGLAKPNYKDGRPKVDRKNPNPALRKRRVMGLTILYNVHQVANRRWDGMIYNADDGHTYAGHLYDHGNNATLKACVAFLCKSMTWVKVR